MNPDSLIVRYKHLFPEIKRLSRAENIITEENVFQPANEGIRKIMDEMCAESLLPTSEVRGLDHIRQFVDALKAGKRGIILMEHYSNFDLPGLIHLLSKSGPDGAELGKRIVAIAGMKLNEENPYVSAFAEAYTRIVIYPSRSLSSITDPDKLKAEEQRSRVINMASMRALDRTRKEGNCVLVFPAGTRYRPGKPETKQGVREIDSYIRLSDVMLLFSINGNCLRFSEDPKDMLGDILCNDRVIYTASPVFPTSTFRADALAWAGENVEDKKQMVVDYVMHCLEAMHEENEKGRI